MKRIVSWECITEGCSVLAQKVSNDVKFDIIIAIGRGGLIPATILSNYLDIPKVFNFGVKSYTADNKKGQYDIYQDLSLIEGSKYFSKSNILVVDDLSDTGDTFAYVMLSLAERFANRSAKSATLYVKPEAKYIPDFYYKMLKTSPWLVFPWEQPHTVVKYE